MARVNGHTGGTDRKLTVGESAGSGIPLCPPLRFYMSYFLRRTQGQGGIPRAPRKGLARAYGQGSGNRPSPDDESGQAILEYILILSVVVVGAGLVGRGVLASLDRGVMRLGGQLEKDLRTGRQTLGAWKN
jgi:hypothetical protein